MKRVTIYDISEILNISPSTVSRALNDSPSVKTKTKEKIIEVAKQLNYFHNKTASRLKTGKNNTVGIIVPYINHSIFSAIIQVIEEILAPLGYIILICQTYEKTVNEIKHIQSLLTNQVECIFVSVTMETINYDHFKKVTSAGIPLIFFDRKADIENVSSVILNDFKSAYKATEHLIEQGCKRIAHFKGNQNLEIYRNRYDGYLKALKDYKIPVDPDLIISCKSSIEEGKRAFNELYNANISLDAIFSPNDHAILGAYQEIKNYNIKVPEEIALVGFSNEIFTKYIEIPITTVFQNPELMGTKAAKFFLEQTNKETTDITHKNEIIEGTLLVRASSKKR
ncbi:LacI family DNA-binding transcriptional regulator [Neptunitalea lumnitzerae]|uniref:LacI family transcriptional regulator n=1 Tax=Neptunitalea lumnitzerae TaxID=2965509 RepID=A0ABQ5MK06_9FLAO|nr:LacI family DNA-binding transcriptional regulator [Neptunitalea sp. Y10]GLB49631.1 LacI family transcriptional regulator [Neptunitalea sp. Y10]